MQWWKPQVLSSDISGIQSHLCHSLAVGYWTSYFISLSSGLHICKIRIRIALHRGVVTIKGEHAGSHDVLSDRTWWTIRLYKCQPVNEVTFILALLNWDSSGDGRKDTSSPQVPVPAPLPAPPDPSQVCIRSAHQLFMVCLVLQIGWGFFREGPEDSLHPAAHHCQREYLSDGDEVSGPVTWWMGADEVKAGHSLFMASFLCVKEMMALELKMPVTCSVDQRLCLYKQTHTHTHIHMHAHTN